MTAGNSIRIHRFLLPASFLYGLGARLRNRLFDRGRLPSESFCVPLICVGNLAAGGTGKTPHTEYLVRLLRGAGFHVATLSRGYKRHTKGYRLATPTSDAGEIGDEPCQLKSKFPDIRVAVDEQRCRGIGQLLLLDNPPVDVVLLDDAFQHRRVKAGLNILLTDYHRLYCDDALLPAGRLREPAAGSRRAHIVVVTKCPPTLTEAGCRRIARKLRPAPGQQLYFSTLCYGRLRPLFPDYVKRPATGMGGDEHVLVVTGIASPALLVEELETRTPHVRLLKFGDHHDFSRKDIRAIRTAFERMEGKAKRIVTTEKDAARLKSHADLDEVLKANLYELPIEVAFLQDRQTCFNQNIIDYVKSNQRNGNLPEK